MVRHDRPALSLPDKEPEAATVPINVATPYYTRLGQQNVLHGEYRVVLTLPQP
jgi:hypothetical protein